MFKRIVAVGIAFCAAALLTAGPAWSGITGSRHDITDTNDPYNWGTILPQYGACGACHVPHGAGADRLFPSAPTGVAGGFFGPLCASCHTPSGFSSGNNQVWANNSVFAASAHGLENNPGAGTGLVQLGSDFSLTGTAVLNYLTSATSPRTPQVNEIECLSCHDVHNQKSERPFLLVDLDLLCQVCHTNRADANSGATTGYSNPLGNHPVGAAFTGDLLDASGVANNGATGNSPFVASFGTLLTTYTDNATGSVWSGQAAWNSGMKLVDGLATGTAGAGVGCNACHNVHWDDNALITGNTTFYLGITGDNSGGANNAFCEYCHRGSATGSGGGYFWNPGATAYSHPNDDVQSTSITLNPADIKTDTSIYSPQSGTGASTIVCTSCHGVHRGDSADPETEVNSPAFLNYTTGDLCSACHSYSGLGFNHHPVGGAYATAGNTAGGVTCAGGNTGAGIGTCHGGGTNGGSAHNRLSPLGEGVNTNASAMCTACHTTNPSIYTTSTTYTAAGSASHFVGEVTTAGFGARTTGTSAIRAAGVDAGNGTWNGSGLQSKWGATATTIICESCHSLKGGNIISGDGNTSMLLELAGAARNTVASTAATGATQYTGTPYLCTGCHLVPSGTHPLLNADGTRYPLSSPPGQSYTSTTKVNCESCHSAHDAATVTGSYILDGGSTGSGTTGMEVEPIINYTGFCAVCHGTFQ